VGAAATYLARLVKQISAGDEPLRVVLHTALGAFLAAAVAGKNAVENNALNATDEKLLKVKRKHRQRSW